MLNKNYLKYLFKSKKYFLFFIVLIQAILTISNINYATYDSSSTSSPIFIGYFISMIVAFVMPIIVFSYVHNKKAIDTYYPLGMSRKEMLVTGVVYCLLVSFITYIVSVFVTLIASAIIGRGLYTTLISLWTIPLALVNYLLIIVFNTAIYLLANTLFDGIVMLGAYSLLSVALYVLMVTFQDTFLVGTTILSSGLSNEILVYLSPVALSFMSYLSLTSFLFEGGSIGDYSFLIYLIVIILYLIIFGYILYKEYINRKTERAGNYSNEFFAYPFVIGLYTVICLFFVACQINMATNISETTIYFVIIFVLYVIANFVYKRKFSINLKQVILFVLAGCLSIGFNILSVNTKGFGLSEIYDFDYDKMSYTLYEYVYDTDLDGGLSDFIKELGGEVEDGYTFELDINSSNKDVVDIMESYRTRAIKRFYDNDFASYVEGINSTLYIKYDNKNTKIYTYNKFSLSDLKTILSLDSKNIVVSYYNADLSDTYFIIYEDGKYKLLNSASFSVYNYYDYQTAAELEDSFSKTEEVPEE